MLHFIFLWKTQVIWQYWTHRPQWKWLAQNGSSSLRWSRRFPVIPTPATPSCLIPKGLYSFVLGCFHVDTWVCILYPDLHTTKPNLLASTCWRESPVRDTKSYIPLEKMRKERKQRQINLFYSSSHVQRKNFCLDTMKHKYVIQIRI